MGEKVVKHEKVRVFKTGPTFTSSEISLISYKCKVSTVALREIFRFDHITIGQAASVLLLDSANIRSKVRSGKLTGTKYFPTETSKGIFFVMVDSLFLELLLSRDQYIFYKSRVSNQ